MSLSQTNAITSYTATSSLIYTIGFTYEDQTEVKVRTLEDDGTYSAVTNWGFLGTTQIQFTSTPPTTFDIYRTTDVSRSYGSPAYAIFRAGSQLDAADLNQSFELLRRAVEENTANLEKLLFEDHNPTAADLLATLKTVDGAGSGLDSDLLDGQHGSYYLDYNNLTNAPNDGLWTATGNNIYYTLGDVLVGTTATTIGSKMQIHNGSDENHILGITGADQTSEYLGLGVQAGQAVITAGNSGTDNTDLVIRTSPGGTETPQMYIASGGNVGIGATSPAEKLEVQSASNTTIRISNEDDSTAKLYFRNVGSTDMDISVTNAEMSFNGGSDERMRIDSSGLVGIGTTDPNDRLAVGDPSGDQRICIFSSTTSNEDPYGSIIFRHATAGGNKNAKISAVRNGGSSGADLTFSTRLHGDSVNNDGGVERMRIDSSGKVGIGTSSPSQLLDLASYAPNIRLTDTVDGYSEIDGNAANLKFNADKGNQKVGSNISFAVDNDEKMRIDSSGRLLHGLTTAYANFFNSTNSARVQVGGYPDTALIRQADDAYSASFILAKTRSLTNTVVEDDDSVGEISFQGNDGSQFVGCASIKGEIDGAPDADDMPGRLVFSTTADGASSPSPRMTILSSGNVGIGLTNPTVKLSLADTAAGTGFSQTSLNILRSNYGGQVGGYIDQGVGHGLVLSTVDNGTASPRMKITNSGKVGIGTTSPAHALDVNCGTDNIGIKITSTDAGSYQQFADNSTTGEIRLGAIGDEFKLDMGGSERLRIDSSGNVGIGTTDPTANVESEADVSSTTQFSGFQGLRLQNKNGAAFGVTVDMNFVAGTSSNNRGAAIGVQYMSGSKNDLYFATNGGSVTSTDTLTERMRLESAGRLMIGASSAPTGGDAHAQNAKLLIQGRVGNNQDSGRINLQRGSTPSSGSSIGTISFTDSSNNGYARITAEADGDVGSNDYPGRIRFHTTADGASSPTEHFRIANNGDLTATDTTIGSNSDSRLKTNINDYTYSLDVFKQYKPKTFDWKNPELHGNKTNQRGFIAQDVEAIDDYWVDEHVIEEGSPDAEFLNVDRIAKTLKLGKKDAMYISVIQQLLTKIESLEQRLTNAGH